MEKKRKEKKNKYICDAINIIMFPKIELDRNKIGLFYLTVLHFGTIDLNKCHSMLLRCRSIVRVQRTPFVI